MKSHGAMTVPLLNLSRRLVSATTRRATFTLTLAGFNPPRDIPTIEPVSGKGPEIIKSDPEITVEQLPPLPRSELNLKKIRIASLKTVDLTRYLNPRKPAFFYMEQAQGKIWINREEHPLIVGNSLGLTLPAKVKVENITPVPLVLLVIQA